MIKLISKFFIPNYKQTNLPEVRQSYGVLCGFVGIILNLLLFAGKFIAGFISGSIAITADAFNNLSDAGSSLITLIGFRMAGQKPDPSHPFGHGRIEYLSGLLVSILILLMAVELLKTSVGKVLHPVPVEFSLLPILILVCSIAVKLYMAYYNRSIGKTINSAAMKATSTDSLSDVLATTAVLASMLLGHLTGLNLDGVCGVVVGFFILYAGYCAARDTISPLLGQPPSDEFVESVEEIVMSYEEVIGIHDLIVHDYGPGRVMISLHAEVPSDGSMMLLHDTIDNIEHQLHEALHCEAVIHMDPVDIHDRETLRLKKWIDELMTSIDPRIQFHDFRIVKGPTHTNLIFDVVVPYDYSQTDDTLILMIQNSIHEVSPNYHAVIQIDKAYRTGTSNLNTNDKKESDQS